MQSGRCSRVCLFAVLLCVVLATGVCATDIYLVQFSDTHYTSGSINNGTKATVQAMNNMQGMLCPLGTIGTIVQAIHCGDVTDGGLTDSTYTTRWNGFNYNFPTGGVGGDNNRLRYSIAVVGGNHDRWRVSGYTGGTSNIVRDAIYNRYSGQGGGRSSEGNNYYSFVSHGIYFAVIGRYPDSTVLSWLSSYLSGLDNSTPVVLVMHYDFEGGNDWWSAAQRTALYNVINGKRIIAILHGHTHQGGHYTWNGYNVIDDGSTRYFGGVNVLHITNYNFDVAHYDATCAGGAYDSDDGTGYWNGGNWTWTCYTTFNPTQNPPSPPNPGAGTHIQYVAHVANIGWQSWVMDGATAGTTGQNKRMEALCVRSLNTTITYRAHISDEGWLDWVTNGAMAGTTGLARRIEAMQITAGSGYSVSYQAHVEGIGWQSVVSNGATAGTTGQGRRMEAIRIWLTAN